MGLKRLISDITGETIPKRIIDKLKDSSEIRYHGRILSISDNGRISLRSLSGYEIYYSKDGKKIAEYFPSPIN